MSVILNIDTALDIACISIAKDGVVINSVSNTEQKDHGGFLQPAIKALLDDATISVGDLDAVAIAAGPGSYTGLRVGMASAKGLCYALKKPLITVGTLEILTFAAVQQYNNTTISSSSLLCPMIDARRMEVFTALYDFSLKPVLDPFALVLDENSFAKSLLKNQVLFFGNGSAKWEAYLPA
jgi:tRNA threonylcarbamoyladenosine biosynthesis protein TsaB